MSSGQAQFRDQSFSSGVPSLLLELDPWHRVFFRNLADLVGQQQRTPISSTLQPAEFWPDVFVSRSIPWTSLRQSLLYHLFVLTAVWGFTQTWLLRPPVKIESPARHTTLTYYQVSEYLPPVFTPSAPAKVTQHGQPAYAKQPIISMPARADNSYQTIVNPAAPKLIPHEVKLPNLVASAQVPEPPVAAATRSTSQLTIPWLAAAAVPPPQSNAERRLSDLQLQSRAPAAVEPPPDPDAVKRKLGDINIAHAVPQPPAPALPVTEQRAQAAPAQPAHATPPPPPPVAIAGTAEKSVGQLIALGLNPVPPAGPIEVPAGNRRGVFAATPEGKLGAPGIPEITAGRDGNGGTTAGSNIDAPGIFVGGRTSSSTPVVANGTFGVNQNNALVAAARPNPDIPRQTPGASLPRTPVPGSVEQEVFGPKKYYSMTLNMPNLTSAGGSWIIRFAALKDNGADQSDLTAPVAIHKVDPAYPPSLIRAHVEGTVTLYAVIRADGTVDGVKVLRGVDDTLDQNARVALSHWHFRPATRNGAAVDLEAVVQIPFAARRPSF